MLNFICAQLENMVGKSNLNKSKSKANTPRHNHNDSVSSLKEDLESLLPNRRLGAAILLSNIFGQVSKNSSLGRIVTNDILRVLCIRLSDTSVPVRFNVAVALRSFTDFIFHKLVIQFD